MNKKFILGLTGVFGSGKSTVSHLLEELGAFVISADQLAHEALWKDSAVYGKVKKAFPEVSESKEGLNRKELGAIVFRNPARLKSLEEIIHPYVRQRMESEIVAAIPDVVVLEIPLLFEAKMEWFCDAVAVVEASQETIEKRLQEKGFSREEIQARLSAQMPAAEKKQRADYVIDNSHGLRETKVEVEKLWREIKKPA